MKISASEIWNFLDQINEQEKGWKSSLYLGVVVIEDLGISDLLKVKNDSTYDTELLPELFTFREILWQPDVFTSSQQLCTPIRVLSCFCSEQIDKYEKKSTPWSKICLQLLESIKGYSDKAVKVLEEQKDFQHTLREFRKELFPIIKFLIYHPGNRQDYRADAINRLNYAVKIMLTDYNGRYTELIDPYFEVSFQIKQKIKSGA